MLAIDSKFDLDLSFDNKPMTKKSESRWQKQEIGCFR